MIDKGEHCTSIEILQKKMTYHLLKTFLPF